MSDVEAEEDSVVDEELFKMIRSVFLLVPFALGDIHEDRLGIVGEDGTDLVGEVGDLARKRRLDVGISLLVELRELHPGRHNERYSVRLLVSPYAVSGNARCIFGNDGGDLEHLVDRPLPVPDGPVQFVVADPEHRRNVFVEQNARRIKVVVDDDRSGQEELSASDRIAVPHRGDPPVAVEVDILKFVGAADDLGVEKKLTDGQRGAVREVV